MVSPPDQQNTHNLAETTDKNGSHATEFVPGALGAGDRTECAGDSVHERQRARPCSRWAGPLCSVRV